MKIDKNPKPKLKHIISNENDIFNISHNITNINIAIAIIDNTLIKLSASLDILL